LRIVKSLYLYLYLYCQIWKRVERFLCFLKKEGDRVPMQYAICV
jgi:hypothetical protein